MQNIETLLQIHISNAFKNIFAIDVAPNSIKLTPTRKEFEGSHTFTCFQFSKKIGKAPDELGNKIGVHLMQNCKEILRFNIVKGFLNIVLTDEYFISFLQNVYQKMSLDFLPIGEKVMLEFASPNTNKPLHLGHLRNIFLGHSMSNILKSTGYEVIKVNLINDRGIHICKSMLAYQIFGNNETPQSINQKGDKLVGKYYVEFEKQSKIEKAKLIANGTSEEDAEKLNPLLLKAQEMLIKWENGDIETVNLWKK